MESTERIAELDIRLRGFVAPDTRAAFEGYLEPGRYVVEEERLDEGAGADTDYARVLAPALGAGDTWICTRWRQQRYARLFDVERPAAADAEPGAASDPLAIPERALRELLPAFAEFTYDLDDARYPFELKGASTPQAPPRSNNCCTFVEALVVRAWQDERGVPWSAERHRQMMIMSQDDFYSPVTAVVEAGLAHPLPENAAPRPWTLVQGWRHQWRGGHTFLIVAHHRETDRVLTLESNSSYRLNGVGFRQIGNLRDSASPPDRWWEAARLWTWKRIRTTYRSYRAAALKVTELDWGDPQRGGA